MRASGEMVYYQILDVSGKSQEKRISSVIQNLVLNVGMHPVGGLESRVTSAGEISLQLLRESHIYSFQSFGEEGEFIIPILSCKHFSPKLVRDYLQRNLGVRRYKISGYVRE